MAKKGIAKTVIFIVVIVAIFLPSFAKYQELLFRYRNIDRQLKAALREIRRLEEEKLRLETDITYIEKKAREKMGVAKQGEIILKDTPTKP